MSHFRNSIPIIFGFIAIGIIIGVVLTTGFNLDTKSVAGSQNATTIYTEGNSEQSLDAKTGNLNPQRGFVDVVKKVRPAIVAIYSTKNVKVPANPFHYFFRGFGQDGQPNEDQGEREIPQTGLGSGIIVSEDGYILTNHHVIKDVDKLNIQLFDGEEYEAEVVGTDPETEVALIKINAKGLTRAVLGNSEQVEVGEWVLAIGSPLELKFTVTAGIVSALSRDINIIGRGYAIENFIQTDAAINPGNSGGALVNQNGEVIGVNTAIKTETGTYIGYGFAVPINLAKTVMDDFIKYGEVRRGYIGVNIETMTPVKAQGVGLDKPIGVFISNVLPGKAADKAGIAAGDVILKVDDKEVNQPNQLQALVGTHNPGDKISLQIWRDGKKRDFTITLEGRDEQMVAAKEGTPKKQEKVGLLGIQLRDMEPKELSQFELDNGIVILNVDQTSPAAKEGLRRGDVIFKIDGEKVESVSEFQDYLNDKESGAILKIQIRSRYSDGSTSDRLVFLQIPK